MSSPQFLFIWDGVNAIDEADYVVDYDVQSGFSVAGNDFLFNNVADVGRAWVVLDNASGRFLPRNSSSPLFGDLNVGTVFRFNTFYEGRIVKFDFTPGIEGEQLCTIYIEDDIALLQRAVVDFQPILEHPVDEAMDDLYQASIDGLSPAPFYTTDWDDNGDSIAVFGQFLSQNISLYEMMQQICTTYFGWFWIGSGIVFSGSSFVYSLRAYFMSREGFQGSNALSIAASSIYTADDVVEMDVISSADYIRNRIDVIYHPRHEIGTISILFTMQNNQIGIAPGATRKIYCRYRDPETGRFVISLDVENLAATTDYLFNSQPDGNGINLTGAANISISMVAYVSLAVVTITNSRAAKIHLTHLQVRGKPVIIFDPVEFRYEDVSSQNTYGLRSQEVHVIGDPPSDFSNDLVAPENLGALWLAYLKEPYYFCRRLVQRNTLPHAIMEYMYIEEAETDLEIDTNNFSSYHRIMRLRWYGDKAEQFTEYHFMPGRFYGVFILDDDDWGVLDTNRLGI
jgi:hypothetical protein